MMRKINNDSIQNVSGGIEIDSRGRTLVALYTPKDFETYGKFLQTYYPEEKKFNCRERINGEDVVLELERDSYLNKVYFNVAPGYSSKGRVNPEEFKAFLAYCQEKNINLGKTDFGPYYFAPYYFAPYYELKANR